MERKFFIKTLGVSLATGSIISSCAAQDEKKENSPLEIGGESVIVHSVYFWLREDLTEEEQKEFPQFFEALKKVPGISAYRVGKPAPTTKRDVVDNSFSYHWLAFFENMDDINTYEKHPDHLAAAEKYSSYWTRVEVRDSLT
ncbi:Dabb family protein [Sphingobacterium corticis]|uniref:Dabb family protein n=1 Tax=Sphingobacterium corticis TaxID=1812823 RepID=A0ABW5NHI4_9SPHI